MRVAVYGSLKKGFGNHIVMERAGGTYLGADTIRTPFKMLDLGAFPALVPATLRDIYVEVYDVLNISPLDGLEGYPRFYNRTEVSTKYGSAWIYYIENSEDYLEYDEVVSGVW